MLTPEEYLAITDPDLYVEYDKEITTWSQLIKDLGWHKDTKDPRVEKFWRNIYYTHKPHSHLRFAPKTMNTYRLLLPNIDEPILRWRGLPVIEVKLLERK